jgi:hypothetical protein
MRAPKKKAGEKLRPWRVALMRSRTHYLGVVYALETGADLGPHRSRLPRRSHPPRAFDL